MPTPATARNTSIYAVCDMRRRIARGKFRTHQCMARIEHDCPKKYFSAHRAYATRVKNSAAMRLGGDENFFSRDAKKETANARFAQNCAKFRE
jgi:hypothetical protein